MRALFTRIDADGDQSITQEELTSSLAAFGVTPADVQSVRAGAGWQHAPEGPARCA